MSKYIINRLVLMIPVLLGVTLVIFTMLYLTPGDPARVILGDDAGEEEIQKLREDLGLNDPYIIRFKDYVINLTKGDMGVSYITGRPVTHEIISRYPTTMLLATLSILVGIIIAIPLGILAATHQNTFIDTVARMIALVGVSMPNFWQSLLFILLFAVNLSWLPATGFYGPKYWILPSIVIGTSAASSILRTTRSSMLETIRQDYIRTVRAKGAPEKIVIWDHALKNALIPVLTIIGIRFGTALGGSIVVESIFSIPGVGKFMVDAIKTRDYPIVQGGVLLIALSFSVINLLVDLLYAYVDPRIKSQYGSKKKSKGPKAESGKAVS